MNILHLIASSKVGGAQTNLLNLVPHLRKAGCEIFVGFGGKGPLAFEFKRAGAIVKTLSHYPLNYKSPHSWMAILRLIKFVKKNKIDIVHAHLDVPYLMAILSKSVTRVPTIFHIHDFGMFSKKDFPFLRTNWVSYLLSRLIYPFADKIIVIASQTKEVLEKRKRLVGKVELLHNGMKVGPVRYRHVRDDSFRFISIGRVTEQKNQEILVKVSEIIPVRYRFNIQIVGDGPLLHKIEEDTKRQGLEERINLLGFRRDIFDLLEESDCFLLPSLWELCPITILEAMSSGIPVIASDVGGVRDMVEYGKTGFLVSPGDQDALAAAMMRIMDNREASVRMGMEGLRMLKRYFSMDVVSGRMVGLYQEILGHGRNKN